jgi:hypothetical protein
MDRLQDKSFLKLRIRLYLDQLSGDEASRSFVEQQIASWKGHRLSPKQKDFLVDYKLVFSSSQKD